MPCRKSRAPFLYAIECQRSELFARQHLIGFEVLLDGLVDDVLGQVVVAVRVGLEPVADELLVKRGLYSFLLYLPAYFLSHFHF